MPGLRSADNKFPTIAMAMKAKIDDLLAAPPVLNASRAQRLFESWKREREIISRNFQQSRSSCMNGIRMNECLLIERLLRSFSVRIGLQPAFGRTGMELFRCSSDRSWSRPLRC